MTLAELGYNQELKRYRQEQNLHDFNIGRIAAEHRERYTVLTENGELEAEVIGQLRSSAADRSGFPAVGDWMAVSVYNAADAIIHAIYSRKSILERQAVGKFEEKQIIATNIDHAMFIQAVDRDFNLNRLERAAYENYQKMVKERIHFQSNIAEKRRKDKEIGKMIKAFKKSRKQNDL